MVLAWFVGGFYFCAPPVCVCVFVVEGGVRGRRRRDSGQLSEGARAVGEKKDLDAQPSEGKRALDAVRCQCGRACLCDQRQS